MQRLSRRNVLARFGAVAGGLAGAGIAGSRVAGATPAAAGDATTARSRAVERFVLDARGLSGIGQRRGPRRDTAGDAVALDAVLLDAAGAEVGTFRSVASVLHTRLRGAALEHLEQHSFELADGLLLGSGIVRAAGEPAEFAVTGGTRAYRFARGSYLAVLRPYHLGGDGTARFEFELVDKE
jgi:hypothetical protein